MMDRNQTALHAALDAAHRERDARTSRDYARRRAAKNRKPPVDLFTAQLGLPSDWRDGFMQESVREHQRRRYEKQQRQSRQMQDEMRMAKWRSAKGQGLRDW